MHVGEGNCNPITGATNGATCSASIASTKATLSTKSRVVGQVEDGLNHCSEQGAEEIACREWKSCWYVPARAPSRTTSSGSTATHCERRHLRPVQCHSRKPPRPEPEGVTAPALNLPLTWLPKTAVRHRNKVGVRLLALSRAPIVAS